MRNWIILLTLALLTAFSGSNAGAAPKPNSPIMVYLAEGPTALDLIEEVHGEISRTLRLLEQQLSRVRSNRTRLGERSSSILSADFRRLLPKIFDLHWKLKGLADEFDINTPERDRAEEIAAAADQIHDLIERLVRLGADTSIVDVLGILKSARFSSLDLWGNFFLSLDSAASVRRLYPDESRQLSAIKSRISVYDRRVREVWSLVEDLVGPRYVYFVGGVGMGGSEPLSPQDALGVEKDYLKTTRDRVIKGLPKKLRTCASPLEE